MYLYGVYYQGEQCYYLVVLVLWGYMLIAVGGFCGKIVPINVSINVRPNFHIFLIFRTIRMVRCGKYCWFVKRRLNDYSIFSNI